MTQPIRVDIVSDVVCPWCVVGYRQLAKAAEETGIPLEVQWHPFELNPQMPDEGQNLREHIMEKYGSTAAQSQAARDRLTELGAGLGFTFAFTDDMRMVNTFRAHQLIHWAAAQGKGHAMKQALFTAYFTHRADLNDVAVLAAEAGKLGLDAAAARAVIESGELADEVREAERFWTQQGITGVPAMVFQRRHLVTGAQGEETYARILRHLAEAPAA
ncbi:DSBA-like thioredoxin domain protein [Pseudoruegeria aquimaris]|uniref:DSBA-like thioredoxin domain protein n=1 Tax=Pseudoruegeria aquimaris TaxID=393663 RepID=A0A1Y5SIZ2_9RHOB|nr:DsbA family oxidoreductase [Pseudoruegeria aquimaris]SLN41887.1 DSBA-like thioredoxin domain protein [Pseudoruegeria aquimaris]